MPKNKNNKQVHRSDMTVHIWDRCFLLQASEYTMNHGDEAYHRLSATLIIGTQTPFILGVNGEPPKPFDAVLLSPNVKRNFVEAGNGGITILDLGISSTLFSALSATMQQSSVFSLPNNWVVSQREALSSVMLAKENRHAIGELVANLTDTMIDKTLPPASRHPKVQKVVDLINSLPEEKLTQDIL